MYRLHDVLAPSGSRGILRAVLASDGIGYSNPARGLSCHGDLGPRKFDERRGRCFTDAPRADLASHVLFTSTEMASALRRRDDRPRPPPRRGRLMRSPCWSRWRLRAGQPVAESRTDGIRIVPLAYCDLIVEQIDGWGEFGGARWPGRCGAGSPRSPRCWPAGRRPEPTPRISGADRSTFSSIGSSSTTTSARTSASRSSTP